jgi:hypothetical protein
MSRRIHSSCRRLCTAVPADPDVLRPLTADPDTAREALTDLMVGPQWRWGHPGPLPALDDDAMTERACREHRRASARHDAWEALPGIVAPTLIVTRSVDPPLPGRSYGSHCDQRCRRSLRRVERGGL